MRRGVWVTLALSVPVIAASLYAAWWYDGYIRFTTTCPAIDALRHADAHADALAAMKRGDNHLLMVGGFVGEIPGGESSSLPHVLMDGTADTVSEPCYKLEPFARRYARRYN